VNQVFDGNYLDVARSRARGLIMRTRQDLDVARRAIRRLTPPELAMASATNSEGFVIDLIALRLLPGGTYSLSEPDEIDELAQLAALWPTQREQAITAAFEGCALDSPSVARAWMQDSGAEVDLLSRSPSLGIQGRSESLGTAHPLREAASALIEGFESDGATGDTAPSPLLPVELAMLSRVQSQRELVLDLIAARLTADGAGPAAGMESSVQGLARLAVMPGEALRNRIRSRVKVLNLSPCMARICLCLGGIEAIRVDPEGVARVLGWAMADHGGRRYRRLPDVGRRSFVDQELDHDLRLVSACDERGTPTAMELRPRLRREDPDPGLGLRRWSLPVELSRALGHGKPMWPRDRARPDNWEFQRPGRSTPPPHRNGESSE
jgi:hypothetical protein